MFGSQRRIRTTSIVASTSVGVAIKFFGAPPVLLFIVAFGGVALVMKTHEWMQRHPDAR